MTTLHGASTEATPPKIAMFEYKTDCSSCLKHLETSPVGINFFMGYFDILTYRSGKISNCKYHVIIDNCIFEVNIQ